MAAFIKRKELINKNSTNRAVISRSTHCTYIYNKL